VPQEKLVSLLAFLTLFATMLLLSTAIMVASGIDVTNSLTIAFSLISNVGAGLDTNIGPVMSWTELSTPLKWLCSFLMLVCRLEIISVLVIFTRSFWKKN
jgi:trk system potassium uptake protein TrkH